MPDSARVRTSRRLKKASPSPSRLGLITRFNETASPPGSVTADLHLSCVRYRITKLEDAIHNQDIYDLVNRLSKADLSHPTVIDLNGCRVVSSIDLSFIGFVLNQTRYHRGRAVIVGANRIVARALAMVGFDRLCVIGTEADITAPPPR
ncbi:MAG: hypothetical protein J0M02_11075 [Planctomycetes bacterium]|nr:hypothetical protein [Planctomycetota bacterium]